MLHLAPGAVGISCVVDEICKYAEQPYQRDVKTVACVSTRR